MVDKLSKCAFCGAKVRANKIVTVIPEFVVKACPRIECTENIHKLDRLKFTLNKIGDKEQFSLYQENGQVWSVFIRNYLIGTIGLLSLGEYAFCSSDDDFGNILLSLEIPKIGQLTIIDNDTINLVRVIFDVIADFVDHQNYNLKLVPKSNVMR